VGHLGESAESGSITRQRGRVSRTFARRASRRADAAQQFLDYLNGEGIPVVNTCLVNGLSSEDESTATGYRFEP
jgi:hypothetical protein